MPFSPFLSPLSPLLFFLPLLVSRDIDLILRLSLLFLYLPVSSFSLRPSFVVKPFPPSVNNSLSRILSLSYHVFLSIFFLPPSISLYSLSSYPISIHLLPHYFSLFIFLRKATYLAIYPFPSCFFSFLSSLDFFNSFFHYFL